MQCRLSSPLLARIIAIIVAVCLVSSASALDAGDTPPPKLGITDAGEIIDLRDYKDKVVIISFWASWCGVCLQELPVLEGIQNSAGPDVLAVFAVNFKEDKRAYRQARARMANWSIKFTHDPKGIMGSRFGVRALPFMVIVDRDGKIAFQHLGYDSSALQGIVDEINSLL